MRTDNKKAVSTTLTAFQNSQTQSHHNMTVSNKKASCLEPSIITNRLVLLLAGGYSESTTLNHVVRFGDLLKFQKRRTNAIIPIVGVFLCLSFNGSRAWETMKIVCWFSFFVPVRQPTHDYRPICLATNSGSFLNQQIRKLQNV